MGCQSSKKTLIHVNQIEGSKAQKLSQCRSKQDELKLPQIKRLLTPKVTQNKPNYKFANYQDYTISSQAISQTARGEKLNIDIQINKIVEFDLMHIKRGKKQKYFQKDVSQKKPDLGFKFIRKNSASPSRNIKNEGKFILQHSQLINNHDRDLSIQNGTINKRESSIGKNNSNYSSDYSKYRGSPRDSNSIQNHKMQILQLNYQLNKALFHQVPENNFSSKNIISNIQEKRQSCNINDQNLRETGATYFKSTRTLTNPTLKLRTNTLNNTDIIKNQNSNSLNKNYLSLTINQSCDSKQNYTRPLHKNEINFLCNRSSINNKVKFLEKNQQILKSYPLEEKQHIDNDKLLATQNQLKIGMNSSKNYGQKKLNSQTEKIDKALQSLGCYNEYNSSSEIDSISEIVSDDFILPKIKVNQKQKKILKLQV